MKNDLKMKFEKGRKKEKTARLLFWPKRPSLPPAPAHLPPPFFFFLPRGADSRGPPVSLPSSPFLFFFPALAGRRRSRAESAPPPPSPLPFPPLRARQLRQLIPTQIPGRFPFPPCLLYARTARRPSMASRRPPHPLPASPTSLRLYLSPCTSSYASLCTRSTPTHPTEPQFSSATASGPRRRRASVAVGEGPPPPPPFSSLGVHQGLIKLNWLQVHVLGARGRRASSTPERRPSRLRR
jgi:hypothetical protein